MTYYDQIEDCFIEVIGNIDERIMCKVRYGNEQDFREFDKTFIENEIELGNFIMQE